MVGTLEAWTDPAPITRLCWRHEGRFRASTIATEQKQKHCKETYSSYAGCKNACGMLDNWEKKWIRMRLENRVNNNTTVMVL